MLILRLFGWSIILTGFLRAKAIVPPAPFADPATKDFYKTFDEDEFLSESDPRLQQGSEVRHLAENPLVALSTDVGFFRVLVVLTRFTDHANKSLPAAGEISTLFNSNGISASAAPTGSISDWIKANSYGRLKIEAEVINWTLTNNTESYFASDTSGTPAYGVTHEMQYAMFPILDQLDASGFNFSRFDGNEDGNIDAIVLLHSGFAAELGNVDCYTNATSDRRIWSHAVATPPNPWVSTRTGIRSHAYAVGAGIRGSCNSRIPRMGVITHEIMHTFSLPDLYDITAGGLGFFDIMSNPYGRTGNQLYPGFLSPWCKMQLKWLDPIPIVDDGLYTIGASQLTNQTYIIQKGYPEGEYLLIENRQSLLWDNFWYVNGSGLLIWHIDDTGDRRSRFRGYPGQADWPGNGNHYQIAVEQADRQYHLERGNNSGDDGDFWRSGSEYAPGIIESIATKYSLYPNSNSYKNGDIKGTGVRVYDISPSSTTMTFRVQFLTPMTAAPVTLAPTTGEPSLDPTGKPSSIPTSTPSHSPTDIPTTQLPTVTPTGIPTTNTPTLILTGMPTTNEPTRMPSGMPTTNAPTQMPTGMPTTNAPTQMPTGMPTTNAPTRMPTAMPTTNAPTRMPTGKPTTRAPTRMPTGVPTSKVPTQGPTRRRPTTQKTIKRPT